MSRTGSTKLTTIAHKRGHESQGYHSPPKSVTANLAELLQPQNSRESKAPTVHRTFSLELLAAALLRLLCSSFTIGGGNEGGKMKAIALLFRLVPNRGLATKPYVTTTGVASRKKWRSLNFIVSWVPRILEKLSLVAGYSSVLVR